MITISEKGAHVQFGGGIVIRAIGNKVLFNELDKKYPLGSPVRKECIKNDANIITLDFTDTISIDLLITQLNLVKEYMSLNKNYLTIAC